MSTEHDLRLKTLVAGADLSGSQFRFVTINSSGLGVVANATSLVAGVLRDKPKLGFAGAYAHSGTCPVIAGGAIAAGARVTSDANGAAVTATTGDSVAGVARTAASAAGEMPEIDLTCPGVAVFAAIT